MRCKMRLEEWTNRMRESANLTESFMAALEIVITAVVGRLATWVAPLPSAVLVGRAVGQIFDLAGAWPAVMAGTVELIGLVTANLWLTAKEWNANKRKSDPSANERLALGLLLFYFVITLAILAVIEIPKVWDVIPAEVASLTALLFPGLSAVAVMALNERMAQAKRQAALDSEIAERKRQQAKHRVSKPKQTSVQASVQASVQSGVQASVQGDVQDVQNTALYVQNAQQQVEKAKLLDRMLDIYLDSPGIGATEMSEELRVSRSTVYNYLNELEQAGRVRRNGDGVEVIE